MDLIGAFAKLDRFLDDSPAVQLTGDLGIHMVGRVSICNKGCPRMRSHTRIVIG